MRRVARRWPWLVFLTVTWVLLQGELTVGNALGGAAASAIVLLAVPVAAEPRTHRVHPVGLLRYLGFVSWSLVTSSAVIVRTTLAPSSDRLRSGIVRCELPGASPLVTTLVAHAITLTPGTLTVTADASADPAVLHVHVLGLGDIDAYRDEVSQLHRRARAALTPDEHTASALLRAGRGGAP